MSAGILTAELIDPLVAVKECTALNLLEQEMAKFPRVEMPLTHRFIQGGYGREISIPAGTLATTKIHRFEHFFVILRGKVRTWTVNDGVQEFNAPYVGITKSGTRRVVFAVTDVEWITFHRTDNTDLNKIEAEIIEPHDIPEQAIPANHLEALQCTH